MSNHDDEEKIKILCDNCEGESNNHIKYVRETSFIAPAILMAGLMISGAILYDKKVEAPIAGDIKSTILKDKKEEISGIPNITETDPIFGNPNAPVKIVVFEDFECPFCKKWTLETLEKIKNNEVKSGKAAIVWKDFPIMSLHPYADKIHEAARCAWEQNKFWEFHDKIFGGKDKLNDSKLKDYAKEINLDQNKFNDCFDSKKYAKLIKEKLEEGYNLNVSGTPTVFVNDKVIIGAQPYKVFSQAIKDAIKDAIKNK